MAFVYRNKDYNQLSNKQMIADVLITHNKITADIRNILWMSKIIDFNGSTHLSVFELSRIFIEACAHELIDRDKALLNLDVDYSAACKAYENFIIPDISNYYFNDGKILNSEVGNKSEKSAKRDKYLQCRVQDKYKQYSYSVDKWYDFFMLPTEEQMRLFNLE